MKLKFVRYAMLAGVMGCGSLATIASAQAATGAAPDAGTKAPTHGEYAVGVLKRVADRLSGATNFTFKTESSVEVISPAGHLINYYSQADVAVHRPDKLVVKKTGDGPAFDLFYDGKTFAALDTKQELYAQMAAPPTLDELIPFVQEKTGMHFPYADVLYSNVYNAVAKDLTHAYWVGKTTVDGVVCDHLAFAGPGIEWQLWVGPDKDPLPRRLAVTMLTLERQPRFLVNFTAWNLQAKLSASKFDFKKPAGAHPIEFRPIQSKLNP